MKKILVVTGTSDNKRNFTVNYIAEFMKEKEVEAEVVGESIYDVTEVAEDISAIVAIGQPQFTTDLPIIDGTPFITKFNMDTCCQQLLEKL
ncbi:hypothetical protein P7D97_15040 [Enterococcus raffinosus]|uniref:hypothetical protein n=1 Tax=Enterococcus raffinosus TaxID=71452 RepID=UPI001C461B9F|nr:hypothetical protein [Enterococcus raffinosus]MDT2572936.1 hypothetical protein [Enterococcus raffinosus]QXJ59294.1 hypothetical protein J9537_00440 [Enterococcus raffinosus]